MKRLAALVLAFSVTAAIPYFSHLRSIEGASAGRQAYVAVDEALWQHARSDLGDLRLFAGSAEVPYALTIERGGKYSERQDVPVLQPALVGKGTQFILDMRSLAAYDRVHLRFDEKNAPQNFIAETRIEGADDVHSSDWALVKNTVLYDLTSDNLGSSSTLRLPLSTFKYLRVTIGPPIRPADIAPSASAEVAQEEKAVWHSLGAAPTTEQQGGDSVFAFTPSPNVPIDRVEFVVDSSQGNFSRPYEIRDQENQWLASGEISRVHVVRRGQKIDTELTEAEVHLGGSSATPKTLKVVVHNGDDRPLKLSGVLLQQFERRVYFLARQTTEPMRLYYGDGKLEPPIYDFAKLFQKEANAVAARLGPEQANPAFQPRPDDRPWSERHPVVLWAAIIAAVLILGAIALRSIKSTPSAPPDQPAKEGAAQK
jgi:hypothetical protein